jgi:hypothetical protein
LVFLTIALVDPAIMAASDKEHLATTTNEKVHPSRVTDVEQPHPNVDGLLKKEKQETSSKSSSDKESTAVKIDDEKKPKNDAPPPVPFMKMFRCVALSFLFETSYSRDKLHIIINFTKFCNQAGINARRLWHPLRNRGWRGPGASAYV